MNLDPAKLLVILVIGLLVLGPERLPKVARQLGHLWQEFTSARDRVVQGIKEQMPDIPAPPSFRSVLVDPRSISAPEAPGGAALEDSRLTSNDDQETIALWRAQRQTTREVSQSVLNEHVDPSMN